MTSGRTATATGRRSAPSPTRRPRRVPGLGVRAIGALCHGMAGVFGHRERARDASRAMAQAGLTPAVRAADAEEPVMADGTSRRHRVAEPGGREAVHSNHVPERALAGEGRHDG